MNSKGRCSWPRSTTSSLNVEFVHLVDLYNYFIKFDQIETLKLKREGGYGFLMFKTRIGPIKVFEAGEYHNIKGFKVAVCSYQIESRKVLNRDNLKDQIAPTAPKTKKGHEQNKPKPAPIQNKHLNTTIGIDTSKNSGQHVSYVSGKGSHLDSTVNTRTHSYLDSRNQQPKHSSKSFYDSTMYAESSLYAEQDLDNSEVSNDMLLQEVIKEIEELEASSRPQPPKMMKQTIPWTRNDLEYPVNAHNSYTQQYINFSPDNYGRDQDFQDSYYEGYEPYEGENSSDCYLPSHNNDVSYQVKGHQYSQLPNNGYYEPDYRQPAPSRKSGHPKDSWIKQIDSEDPPLFMWDPQNQLPPH